MPDGRWMGPSRSVPGTVAEVLGDLAVTAELSLTCEGRGLQLRADSQVLTIAADSYRDLLALRHRPPEGWGPSLVADMGLEPVILVRDRQVASIHLGSSPPWWQRILGISSRIDIDWLPALWSLLRR